MQKKSKAEKIVIKALKNECKAEFNALRDGFIKKHSRLIALAATIMMLTSLLFGATLTVIDFVFSTMDVTVGEIAPSVLSYDKPASKILRSPSVFNLTFGLDADYDAFQQA